jgi:hypothetical protein
MENPIPSPSETSHGRHELRDAWPRAILIFAISLLATLVLVHLVGQEVLNLLQRSQDADNALLFPAYPLGKWISHTPPNPRLQPEPSHDVLPHADLVDVQSQEQAFIGPESWSWVDSSHQFARIPLQQAIDLMVENGLPEILPATRPTIQPFMPPASALHGPGGIP